MQHERPNRSECSAVPCCALPDVWQLAEWNVMALLNLYRSAILRARIAYHEAALRQIEPHHQDVPYIVLTLCSLTDRLEELKGMK